MSTAAGIVRALAVCAFLAGSATSVTGQVPVPPESTGLPAEGRPAVRPERVAGEVVAGTYAGVVGYFAGRGIGTIATAMMKSDNDRLRERIVNGVGIGGAAFAIGGAVFAIGNLGAETGNFTTTMVGVSAGVAVSLAMSKLVFQGRMPVNEGTSKRKWLMAALDASLPAIGGTIAFNSSRRWQR